MTDLIPGLGQGKYKSLEYLFVPESKEVLKEIKGTYQKGTEPSMKGFPLVKSGTVGHQNK